MTDPRVTPANGRVAALHLAGQVKAEKFVAGTAMQVARPAADLLSAPAGARDRQLLLGSDVTVFEVHQGLAFLQAADGYVGYVAENAMRSPIPTTHFVASFATHAYENADLKSSDRAALPFGARLQVLDERRAFYETDQGFVPKSHLRALDQPFSDPMTVAQQHFGVPYLWGGNSVWGIDCSGLVSASLGASGINCPGDSDMQCETLGTDVAGELRRGDLVFWNGHVGMMVDAKVMIHANAHHMATRYEDLDIAIRRIAAQGDGDVIARKRVG